MGVGGAGEDAPPRPRRVIPGHGGTLRKVHCSRCGRFSGSRMLDGDGRGAGGISGTQREKVHRGCWLPAHPSPPNPLPTYPSLSFPFSFHYPLSPPSLLYPPSPLSLLYPPSSHSVLCTRHPILFPFLPSAFLPLPLPPSSFSDAQSLKEFK